MNRSTAVKIGKLLLGDTGELIDDGAKWVSQKFNLQYKDCVSKCFRKLLKSFDGNASKCECCFIELYPTFDNLSAKLLLIAQSTSIDQIDSRISQALEKEMIDVIGNYVKASDIDLVAPFMRNLWDDLRGFLVQEIPIELTQVDISLIKSAANPRKMLDYKKMESVIGLGRNQEILMKFQAPLFWENKDSLFTHKESFVFNSYAINETTYNDTEKLINAYITGALNKFASKKDPPIIIGRDIGDMNSDIRMMLVTATHGVGKTSLMYKILDDFEIGNYSKRAFFINVHEMGTDICLEALAQYLGISPSKLNESILLLDGIDSILFNNRINATRSIDMLNNFVDELCDRNIRAIATSKDDQILSDIAFSMRVRLLPFSDAQIIEWLEKYRRFDPHVDIEGARLTIRSNALLRVPLLLYMAAKSGVLHVNTQTSHVLMKYLFDEHYGQARRKTYSGESHVLFRCSEYENLMMIVERLAIEIIIKNNQPTALDEIDESAAVNLKLLFGLETSIIDKTRYYHFVHDSICFYFAARNIIKHLLAVINAEKSRKVELMDAKVLRSPLNETVVKYVSFMLIESGHNTIPLIELIRVVLALNDDARQTHAFFENLFSIACTMSDLTKHECNQKLFTKTSPENTLLFVALTQMGKMCCIFNLNRMDLSNLNLNSVNLARSYLKFTNFENSKLCFSVFSESYIVGSYFTYCYMDYSDLQSANAGNALFTYSNLRYANLSNAKLNGARFDFSDLSHADLRNARLVKTSFIGTILHKVSIDASNLEHIELGTVLDNEMIVYEKGKKLTFYELLRAYKNTRLRSVNFAFSYQEFALRLDLIDTLIGILKRRLQQNDCDAEANDDR